MEAVRPRVRSLRRSLAVLIWGLAAVAAGGTRADPVGEAATVRVVLKLLKAKALEGAAAVFDPSSCPACSVGTDVGFSADNTRETLTELIVPKGRFLELKFKVQKAGVRRVVLETGDLSFQVAGPVTGQARDAILTLNLPPLTGDATAAGEFSTHLVGPGYVLRFEHADLARRAGDYASGQFPAVERRAADNLSFAQREFVRRSGLGDRVKREGLGTIQLMGFDTNDPHGHTDSPPHVHMHLRWPETAGTQIGHFYINAQGLLTGINVGGGQFLRQPGRTFKPGETFSTIDRLGRPAYSHTITAAGWLELSVPGQPTCLVRPEDVKAGFERGAVLECPSNPAVHVRVEDHLKDGVLQVQVDNIVENLPYDRDTGALVVPTGPPPPPASGYPPPG